MDKREFLSKTSYGDLRFVMISGTKASNQGQLDKTWLGYINDAPEDVGTIREDRVFIFRHINETIGFRIYFSEVQDII